MEFTIVCSAATFYFVGLDFVKVWTTFVFFPLGAIPFTYVASFAFKSESAAQTAMIFFNFFMITAVPSLVFYIRWINGVEFVADSLHSIFRAFPTYCMGASVYFNQMQKHLAEYRSATSGTGYTLTVDPNDIANVSGDNVAIATNLVFWSFMLLVIEMGLAKKIN
jgi:hypothetical protein